MQAWAAAEAGAAHGPEPFYMTAEFWVAVGFIVFVVLVARTAVRVVSIALDERGKRIKEQIDEAARLAEDAHQLLATYERKQREAAEEAEAIVDNARREADRLAERAAHDLERSLARREELAIERIAQAEQAAIADIRGRIVDVAMSATRQLLGERLTDKQSGSLIDQAIAELPKKLH